MADWQFIIANTDGTHIGELSAATSRQISWPIDAPATAQFTIDGLHPQAALIHELETDLLVYDPSKTLRFRGRFGSSQDQVSTSGHICNFAAIDYRGMLTRRIIWDATDNIFMDQEQADIAWHLIENSENFADGAWGISQGSGSPTGTTRDRTYTEGSNILDMLTELGQVEGGFEWEIDPFLKLNIFYPNRGAAGTQVLDYGGRVTSAQRSVATESFANAVRYSGADGTTAATSIAGSFGTAGRFDIQIGQPSITDPDNTTLQGHADATLALDETVTPTYQVVATPGWWIPDVLWLGDTARLILQSGRLDVDANGRITQIDVALGDSGGETDTFTLGPRLLDQALETNDMLHRLATLERH